MNLTKISKSLLIALPMLALAACSSNDSMDTDTDATNSAAEAAAAAEAGNTVETDTISAVELTEEELMVQEYTDAILETTIQFDFDKAMIKPEFTSILDAHAEFLVDNPEKSLTIEGHTDSKGTPEYNIALGERRAMSVSTYLENMGVSTSQISVVSYGEEKPANPAHNEAAWNENRRAELAY
ncbi:MAG: peptidoglycan-associated lipoprotein Pal [Psychromonas sp.]